MFVLALIITLQNVFIGGHMVKSDMIDSIFDMVQMNDDAVSSEGHFHIDNNYNEDNSIASTSELYKSLAFYPPILNFGLAPIGSAKSQLVMLVNKNTNRSVYLSSISGKTATFYSSFFEDKIVPPQGNTTFNVVFLPRSFESVQTSLLIHTSFGQAKLSVKGQGQECPYRLKPLIGIKAPFNATLSPEILMYNPHSKPIQILEVYSSGGQFQLELPSGGQEGPQALWEIPPLTTKPVIRIRFHATSPGNHTAYIRIKISSETKLNNLTTFDNFTFNEQQNNNSDKEDVNSDKVQDDQLILVVPIEIEVYETHAIYSAIPIIDFGRITNNEINTFKLNLTDSTGKQLFKIVDYQLKNINNLIEFNKNTLNLSINPKKADKNCIINGEIILQQGMADNEENFEKFIEISIPIKAEIIKGSLSYDPNMTVFITGLKNFSISNERTFWIENNFDISINIFNYVIEKNVTNILEINELKKFPLIIKPKERIDIFSVKVLNSSTIFNTSLRIGTNITVYDIPIIISSGKLIKYTSFDEIHLTSLLDNETLDFETVPYGDFSHPGLIILKNLNPFPIQIGEWKIITASSRISYHSNFWGCLRKNFIDDINKFDEEIQQKKSIKNLREEFVLCHNIGPNNLAVFQLDVKSFETKASSATFKIWTDFEEITTFVKFFTVIGRLEIDQSKLRFNDCFPGKTCFAEISIHSTFLKTMSVNGITANVPGINFSQANNLPDIIANEITNLGQMYFDPKSICAQNCYIPYETLIFNESELRRRTELFRQFKSKLLQITFNLNTSDVRLFEFNSTVDIIWPKLVNGIQNLPTIEVGQAQISKIRIYNPSNQLIVAELNLSDPRKAKATRLSLPLEVVEICVHCYLTDQDVFHLDDRAIYIEPSGYIEVDIKFYPKDQGVFSTLLHIRNNLTLYEAVWITAKSVQPQFRFGNRKPGSTTPLLFEINEKHLHSCEKAAQNKNIKENFNNDVEFIDDIIVMVSTKRTFTARNTGEVPIWVENFRIGDLICEGYGFKVLDCESFELKANSSKKIDIAFTPDFTSARVSLPLVLKTNLSYSVNYTLLATIPSGSLEQCSKMLQRPYWENHMQKLSIVILVIALIFVLMSAFFESDKILKDHVNNMAKDKGPVQPALDLRNIAMKCNLEREEQSQNDSLNEKQSISSTNKVNMTLKKRSTKKATSNGTSSYSLLGFKDRIGTDELIVNSFPNAKQINNKKCDEQQNKYSTDKLLNMVLPSNTCSGGKNKIKEENSSLKSTKSKENSSIDLKSILKENKKSSFDLTTSSGDKKGDSQNNEANKRSRQTVKKTKSAPLPLTTANNDSSSNTSGSPVNAYKGEIENLKPKQKIIKPKLPDVVKQSEFLFNGKNNSDNEESLTPNESLTFNDSKGEITGKKYGKTPGRERKKENDKANKRNNERKPPKFKGNAFQFTLPITTSSNNNNTDSLIQGSQNKSPLNEMNPLNNIWNSNQATFSHVVAQNGNLQSPSYLDNRESDNFKSSDDNFNFSSSSTSSIFNNMNEWNEADIKNHETFSSNNDQIQSEISDNKRNSMDLGPIGTRKSPSSTPTVWEPLQTAIIENPTPNLSNLNQQSSAGGGAAASASNPSNSSFFSNNFLNSNFDYSANNLFGGGSQELLSLLNSRWPSDELLLSLLHQQQIKSLNSNSNNTTNWPLDEMRRWTPMGYQNERSNLSTIWQQHDQPPQQQQQHQQINPSIGARPPPGLSLPKRELSQQSQMEKQLQHQQQIQFLLQQQQQQQQQQANNHIQPNNNITASQLFQNQSSQNLLQQTQQPNQQQQQQQQQQQSMMQQQTMQAFDPFHSWNSVWSNTWSSSKNNDDSNNK